MRHYNIPIFIPELACPNQCIYCNQRYISGQQNQPTKKEIVDKIETHIKTFSLPFEAEVAFFGGSFTGIDIDKQKEYLEIVQPYIEKGIIKSIRLSTRPDYINEEILDLLKKYNVGTIELGAQSLCEDVLFFAQRGHSVKDVEFSSKLIREYGFSLGLQMMIGLPEDSYEKSIYTAKKIISLKAQSTRIYPTLVIENTFLAKLYKEKKYTALSLDEAIKWSSEIYKIFYDNNIKILRVGLHPSESLISNKELLAGAFHVSFRQLVKTNIFKEEFEKIPQNKEKTIRIITSKKSINEAIGYNCSNRNFLKQRFNKVIFSEEEGLKELDFKYSLE
ncbi:MAG: radical SAM protein [Bacteroidales bacterium]|jgi:histone acetyltransferase (RNA polymerase elongator complex component)|nr:radical SAM protein [Bacteroidales bacterium]